jgi:hypothetical protein
MSSVWYMKAQIQPKKDDLSFLQEQIASTLKGVRGCLEFLHSTMDDWLLTARHSCRNSMEQ